MNPKSINTLTKQLRQGYALKLGPQPASGGQSIEYDREATEALMDKAADLIESLAWRVHVADDGRLK